MLYAVSIMHRTQIYLPEEDYRELVRLGDGRGQSLAELVRLAVKQFLTTESAADRREVLERTHGLWRDRAALDLRQLRQGWSRREDRNGSAD